MVRCPHDVTDFEPEDNPWFSLNIPKSSQLRQILSPNRLYGYARIDIKLTDPDELLERWLIIHAPHRHNEVNSLPISYQNAKELKQQVYRKFSETLRIVFSAMNALPVKMLEIQLSHMPISKRKITATCFPFSELPVPNLTDIDDFEVATLRYGPIITPIGRSQIYIHHRVDILPLIPRPIRTAPHMVIPPRPFTPSSRMGTESIFESSHGSPVTLTYGRVMTIESFRPVVDDPDFYPMPDDSGHDSSDVQEETKDPPPVAPDLPSFLNMMNKETVSLHFSNDVRTRFLSVKEQVQSFSQPVPPTT